MLPRKKAGGVGSRTLRGKNNKSQPNQVIVVPEAAVQTAVPPALSITQLQCKVRDDARIKEQLRQQIKDDVVTKEELR